MNKKENKNKNYKAPAIDESQEQESISLSENTSAPEEKASLGFKVGDISSCGKWQIHNITYDGLVHMVPSETNKEALGVATKTLEETKEMVL